MKMPINLITLIRFLIIILGFALIQFSTTASHIVGGELTYQYIGANSYKFTFKVQRDCSGIDIGQNDPMFVISLPNLSAYAIFNRQLNFVNRQTAEPYCAQVGNNCSWNGKTNSQNLTFELEVDFNAFPVNVNGIQIPRRSENWLISVELTARPMVRNLTSPFHFFTSTTLNNLEYTQINGAPTISINNNSPIFKEGNIGMVFKCKNQINTISFAASDPDNDSLAYAIVPAKETYTRLVNYSRLDSQVTVNGQKYLALPFTFDNPLPSFKLINDTNGNLVAQPHCIFDKNTGTLIFKPIVYEANSFPSLGQNKYLVSVLVTEYRRVSGAVTKVGSCQKDILVVIEDCGSNLLPNAPIISNPQITNAVFSQDSVLRLRLQACNYTTFDLSFADANNRDLINIQIPSGLGLSGVGNNGPIYDTIITNNNTSQPSLRLILKPELSMVGKSFWFLVKTEDDGCPIKANRHFPIEITVEKQNYAFAQFFIDNSKEIHCSGDPVLLFGGTFRDDSIVNSPNSYKIIWELANGLDSTQINKANPVVYPTENTRYKLRVLSKGFNGNCFDTASILVKVKQNPQSNLRLGYSGARALATGPNIIYRWFKLNGQLVGTADSISISNYGQYFLVVTDTSFGTWCSDTSTSFILNSLGKWQESPYKLFPNPAKDLVKIEGLPNEAKVNLLNTLGQRIPVTIKPEGHLDLKDLSSGYYTVEILSAQQVYRTNLVVER